MQKKIKNRDALLSHGDINGRKIVDRKSVV